MAIYEIAGQQTNSFVVRVEAESLEAAEGELYDLDLAMYYSSGGIEIEYIEEID